MIHSPICDLLNIKYPVFCGGMAHVSDAVLAAAVSNAGGLGVIASGGETPAKARAQIRAARTLTDRPFALNIMLMSPQAAEVAQIAAEESVDVVISGAGSPEKYMSMWRESGITVIPVIPSVTIARRMERLGAAAIIAEGGESGGHVGDLTTMTLLPQVCDAVDIPVIAAGGIGDGRGMAAAFMLGAVGVQMGTRFLVARECGVHPAYKAKVLQAKDTDTIATGKRLGHTVRSLKTPFSRNYFAKEYDFTVTNEELEALGGGALRLAAKEGDEQNGCFMAGQISGLISKEQSVVEIIEEICGQAELLLKGAFIWVK